MMSTINLRLTECNLWRFLTNDTLSSTLHFRVFDSKTATQDEASVKYASPSSPALGKAPAWSWKSTYFLGRNLEKRVH